MDNPTLELIEKSTNEIADRVSRTRARLGALIFTLVPMPHGNGTAPADSSPQSPGAFQRIADAQGATFYALNTIEESLSALETLLGAPSADEPVTSAQLAGSPYWTNAGEGYRR